MQKPNTTESVPVYFQDSHISVIAAEPRALVVRLRTPVLRCIILAVHAPHTGHTDDSVDDWWAHVGKLVPSKYNEWPRLLLCDANARVGSVVTPHIGGYQSEIETSKSEFFRTFLSDQGLWLPCTFDSCQTGPGGTWLHSNGTWIRGDYIGIPVQWTFTSCKAFVSETIDVATLKEDHRTAIVQIEGTCFTGEHRSTTPPLRLCEDQVAMIDATDFSYVQRPEISVDVHTHALLLERQLIQALGKRPCPRHKKPRKVNMTDETWSLVCNKREWRNHLWQAQDLQRQTVLRLCFQGLKDHGTRHCSSAIGKLLAQQDILVAQALFHFRNLGRQVVAAMRADDVAFFRSLAQEAGDFVQPHQAKELWQVIRRSLPKFQQRRLHTPPERIEPLEDQWHPYFQQLEAGSFVSAPDFVQRCHQDQIAHGSVQQVCELRDVPSMQQVEEMFRCTQKGKSTGLDPIASALYHAFPAETARLFFDLILKIYLWQAEPIAYKGGIMAVIPKRVQASLAQHFRGIMLLPSVAKRVHALLRLSTVRLIERIRLQGQMGGFKHQQVGFASQALRTFCRVANQHGFSTGVLFVDLANAFHRLVRELVCGVNSDEDAQAVIDHLEHDHGTQKGLRAWLQVPGLLERLGASPILVQLMREVHTNTWFALAAQPGITRTRRGTRPGSPLADVVFHVLMLDIVTEINAWIESQPKYQEALQSLDVNFDSIVWSDDLAIPWCTDTAAELVPALRRLLTAVDRFFARRGFDLNMDRGKTGIVLTFQGQGAPAMRQEFLLCEPSGFWCQLDGERHQWVHVSASYRHLGSQFASKLDFAEEVKYRIGQAAAAFCAMRKQVFCNKYIPVQIRLKLFQALVCTRLYFGLGAWPTPTAQQLHLLRKALAHYLGNILATGKRFTGKRPPDGRIFAEAGFLEPRIRLAQDRLLYAHKVFQHGPVFVQHLLQIEYRDLPNSWISGLFADIKWLRDTVPDAIPDNWLTSLTEPIDFWQSGAPGWKALIRKAGRRHLYQEGMMQDVYAWHRALFRELDQFHASFDPPFFGRERGDGSFPCSCRRQFDTGQGLATHRRKAHGVFSPEHDLLDGATCPVCLVHFWNTQRLQQHLAYISRRTGRNECYQTLRKSGFTTAYESVRVPVQLRGANRIEAVQSAGPLTQFNPALETQIAQWQCEIERIQDELHNIQLPSDAEAAERSLREGLTQATKQWFARFCEVSYDLAVSGPLEDYWYDYLIQWPHDLDSWYSDRLLAWGQADLPDIVAEFVDGEAEQFADNALYEVSRDMPRSQLRDRLSFLQGCVARGHEELAQDVAHRAVKHVDDSRSSCYARRSIDTICTQFEGQTEWHDALRAIKWKTVPPDARTPLLKGVFAKPIFLVVHLFSGRRRQYDVHWHIAQISRQRGLEVAVLSMDTAVSAFYGDLSSQSHSWSQLEKLYQAGYVAATICGSPCETFSAARHVPPPEDLESAAKNKWPRPLRSFARLFGLAGLRPKELRQCRQGTAFMLQAVMVCVWHLTRGGIFISEHPAPPQDPEKASIWTSAILRLLIQHPDISLRIFNQWQWGAPVRKPTGLLSLRVPRLAKAMYDCADPDAKPPTAIAIGTDHQGHFKTAVCKEYPDRFSKGLAKAVIDQICTTQRSGSEPFSLLSLSDPEVTTWLREALAECTVIRANQSHLPDYQGH